MSYLMKSIRLLIAITLICLMIFVSISIITYNKLDPSSLNAIEILNVHNFFGIYGASIADILMQIFGYSIILPIAFFFIFAIKILNSKPNKFFIYRTLGILFGTLMFSTIFSLITSENIMNNVGYGGVIGDYHKQLLLVHIEKNILLFSLITIFILNTMICLGLTLSEWKAICRYVVFCINMLFFAFDH